MLKFHYSLALITSFVLLLYSVNAAHIHQNPNQLVYRVPASITTTVGELTTVQIDIQNPAGPPKSYRINMVPTSPNAIEITNNNINTRLLNPGESTSVFSNIRTLIDAPNVLRIDIYLRGVTDTLLDSESIGVASKKFSLPEFGLLGFLQIIAIAGIVYLLFVNGFKTTKD